MKPFTEDKVTQTDLVLSDPKCLFLFYNG